MASINIGNFHDLSLKEVQASSCHIFKTADRKKNFFVYLDSILRTRIFIFGLYLYT